MKTRLLRRASAGALTLTLIGATAAFADNLITDGDYAVSVEQNALALGEICAGQTKSGDVVLAINRVGGGQTFANEATVTVSVKGEGDNTSTVLVDASVTLPEGWTSLSNNVLSSETARAKVSVDTAGLTVSSDPYSQTVNFEATGAKSGGGTVERPGNLSVTFKVVTCADANTQPTAEFSFSPSTPDEADEIQFTNLSEDSDGSIASWAWTFGDGGASTDQSPSYAYLDNGTYPVCLTVTDDDGASDSVCLDVTVSNIAPSLSSSISDSVDCRTNAALTWSFTDPGTGDGPWAVQINWGDGSVATQFDASPQGDQADETHAYTAPGTYDVAVTITDKDGGTDTDTHQVEVLQTYATTFLAPFDGSGPSNLITNTMKNGRVVPVKVKLYDECALAYVTDPTEVVTIKVSSMGQTSAVSDPIEIFADAGQSSAGTDRFRWSTDGFWIYNLDSKALGLITNNTYRVDASVDGVKATADRWALLQPVK